MLSGEATNTNFSLWFDPTRAGTHNLPPIRCKGCILYICVQYTTYHGRLTFCLIWTQALQKSLVSTFICVQYTTYHGRLTFCLIWTQALQKSLASTLICVQYTTYHGRLTFCLIWTQALQKSLASTLIQHAQRDLARNHSGPTSVKSRKCRRN